MPVLAEWCTADGPTSNQFAKLIGCGSTTLPSLATARAGLVQLGRIDAVQPNLTLANHQGITIDGAGRPLDRLSTSGSRKKKAQKGRPPSHWPTLTHLAVNVIDFCVGMRRRMPYLQVQSRSRSLCSSHVTTS
jgi:hypothetical protein